MNWKVGHTLKLKMRLSQPSATQLVYQSFSLSSVIFLFFPIILGVIFAMFAINYLSIIQSTISNLGAWIAFLFHTFGSVFCLFWIYGAIKKKILIISTTTIFDKDLYKLTQKTKTVLGGEVLEYSFDLIADIVVDGDKDGLSCMAIRLTNGDFISLNCGWYSSWGFDKKEKIVEQIMDFLNLSEKSDKRGKYR